MFELVVVAVQPGGFGDDAIIDATIVEEMNRNFAENEFMNETFENDFPGRAESLIHRAEIYQELEKTEKASKFYQLALEIFQQLEDQDKVNAIQQKLKNLQTVSGEKTYE